jgi:prepilin-type processing-associated H-X9-DG protein
MKCLGFKRGNRGLTLVEAVVVIFVIGVGVLLILPTLATNKCHSYPRLNCASNLKQVGLAFRIWEGDNGDHYPMATLTNQSGGLLYTDATNAYRYFQVMSNEINNPRVLTCPADTSRTYATNWIHFNSSNISFFVGLDADETRPQSFLAGDANIVVALKLSHSLMEIHTNQIAEWSKDRHKFAGNVGLADGSVQEFGMKALQTGLQNTGFATNRLLFP